MQGSTWKTGFMALCSLGVFESSVAYGSDGRTSAIGTVQQVYDGRLTPDIQANTFRNIDRLFPTRTVNRGGPAIPLEPAPKPLAEIKWDPTDGGQALDGVRSDGGARPGR